MIAGEIRLRVERRFVEEYLIGLNATKAAECAGFSKKTAETQGSRLLRNVQISAAIADANGKRSKRTGIKADRVAQEHGVSPATVKRDGKFAEEIEKAS